MIYSKPVVQQFDTIHRQAKRLSQNLNLPITVAKLVLARAFYRCSGWSDLKERLKSSKLDRHIQLLTALPQSDEARTYFTEISRDLAKSLSQQMLTNTNLAGLINRIREVFAVMSGPATLDELVPTLKALPWGPAGIGPDPWAVIASEVVVNGASLSLVGTRTYLPGCYDFGPNHEHGKYAEPADGKLKIIWTEPMAWHRAALDYLDDPDAQVVQLPVVELNDEMSRHQAWFEAALESIGDIAEYGADNNLLPAFSVGGDCYVVFGHPVRTTTKAEQVNSIAVDLASTDDCFRLVVIINNSPVCLEWIAYDPKTQTHLGLFDDYFVRRKQAILKVESLPVTPRKDGQPGLLFVRPATDFDIRLELEVDFNYFAEEVAFVLKTSNLELGRELIGKVADRDLIVHSLDVRPRYFALLFVPLADNSPELNLAIDIKTSSETTCANLLHGPRLKKTEFGWELLFEVTSKLMNLIDIMGKKTLYTAMSHGLVQRRPIKFLDELEQPPARCRQMPQMPDEMAKALDRRPSGETYLILPDPVRYVRANF